jgi:hypothetical protein
MESNQDLLDRIERIEDEIQSREEDLEYFQSVIMKYEAQDEELDFLHSSCREVETQLAFLYDEYGYLQDELKEMDEEED